MFQLRIETGNAAFDPAAGGTPDELGRLLRLAADRVDSGVAEGVLIDFNGNTVGEYSTDPT